MPEIPLPLGAIESADLFNYGQEKDGCLGNTVTSIVSTISGHEFHLPPIYFAWRGMMIKDELRVYARHMRRDPDKHREESEIALHRLDQRVFKTILKSIRSNTVGLASMIPIAQVLENCDIKYRKGHFTDILEAINRREEVAVMYKTPDDEGPESWWHMAHIGVNASGSEIVRLSDQNGSITDSTVRAIDESADYLNQRARTWNFVAIKGRL